jgi:hypothetical protein
MRLAGFEPAFPVSERPQTHAVDRSATGIGRTNFTGTKFILLTLSILKHDAEHDTYHTMDHLKAL